MIEKYNILLLGSGLMAESVATYLIQKDKNVSLYIFRTEFTLPVTFKSMLKR
jgi:glutamyl-tRNA reductase